ncbi:hypothetical protein PybrP1_001666 [[Pythium] brassicae (nom. inval.)]|nr:hypothetical protein PybrP1_001666 [[Pythium] brassicae (nom. inval.)]
MLVLRAAVSRGAFAARFSLSPVRQLTLTTPGAHVWRTCSRLSPSTRAFATIRDDEDTSKASLNTTNHQQQQQLETPKRKPGKVKALIAQYGVPFLVWWTAVWAGTGVGFYVAFDSGVIAGDDAIKFVMDMGLDRFVDVASLNPTYGNMALAAVLNELIEPVRFPFCVATLPLVKRVFAKKAPEATP